MSDSFLDPEDVSRLRRLVELREARDIAKTAYGIAENEYRELEAEIHQGLSTGPMSRLPNVDLGPPWGKVSFDARETVFAKIIDPNALQEWIENRAMVEELTTPQFAKARINELVRTADEAGDKLPPGTTVSKTRYVAITRQKK